MSKLNYKDQSAAELEYNLLLSADPESRFNILKKKDIRWQGLSVDFSIIGSSHIVRVNLGSIQLVELLSCVESDGLAVKRTYQSKKLINFDNYEYKEVIDPDGLSLKYQFHASSINDKLENCQQFINKYISNSNDQNMFFYYKFPSLNGLAVTGIEVRCEDKKLQWLTYHSYPEEGLIIKTHSLLEGRN